MKGKGKAEKGKEKETGSSKKKGTHNRGGRSAGARNFTEQEIAILLTYVQRYLPIGPKNWQRVEDKFKAWAREEMARPDRDPQLPDVFERDATSLKNKFDRVRYILIVSLFLF